MEDTALSGSHKNKTSVNVTGTIRTKKCKPAGQSDGETLNRSVRARGKLAKMRSLFFPSLFCYRKEGRRKQQLTHYTLYRGIFLQLVWMCVSLGVCVNWQRCIALLFYFVLFIFFVSAVAAVRVSFFPCSFMSSLLPRLFHPRPLEERCPTVITSAPARHFIT